MFARLQIAGAASTSAGELPPGSLADKCDDIAKDLLKLHPKGTPISPPGSIHGHVAVELPNGTILDPSLRDNLKALGKYVDDIPIGKGAFSREEWLRYADRFPKGEPPPPDFKPPPW
jgi:hypothetical protein